MAEDSLIFFHPARTLMYTQSHFDDGQIELPIGQRAMMRSILETPDRTKERAGTQRHSESKGRRLKVCFIIATLRHGRGGHVWSLKTTAEALASKVDCLIVDIGVQPSPAVEAAKVRSIHVPLTGFHFVRALQNLSLILSEERPDVLNLYDERIDFLARIMSMWYRIPLIKTKCGGPSPRQHSRRYYFSDADTVVVYSIEDQRWFSQSPKFAHSAIHLIPNRTHPVTCDPTRVAELRRRIMPDCPVFLRIARLGRHHEQSIVQSINLIRRLNEDGHQCQLLIVGVPEDPVVFDRVRRLCDRNIYLFTDSALTRDAKQVIDLADFVIGTGRGFMEAASRGKVLLTPLQAASFPLLVTPDTFDDVFATNFSARNRIDDFDEDANYRQIAHLLEFPEARRQLRRQALGWFEKYFNVESVLDRYVSILQSQKYTRELNLTDLAFSGLLMCRHFWKARR